MKRLSPETVKKARRVIDSRFDISKFPVYSTRRHEVHLYDALVHQMYRVTEDNKTIALDDWKLQDYGPMGDILSYY